MSIGDNVWHMDATFFETGSHSLAEVSVQLIVILLPQPPKHYRNTLDFEQFPKLSYF